jgi:Domain of unknown function (DUF4091)/Family of unknown function (DUF6067)
MYTIKTEDMKKEIIIACFCILLSSPAGAQMLQGQIDASKLPVSKMHYEPEYLLDSTTDKNAWLTQKTGLHVSFGSTDKLYFRTEVPNLASKISWSETGWKGERLNAQVVLWSADTINQVHFRVHDLQSSGGNFLHNENIRLNLVRYVLSNHPYNDSNVSCEGSPYKNGFLMPDRFEAFDRVDLPGHTVRSVWLSLDIPAATAPGTYDGSIEVQTEKQNVFLRLSIKVQPQVLPKPHDWKYRLDLWQNPWVVADYLHLSPWSAEHIALLKKHLQLYADAGGKYITTYGVHSPWADVSYATEGGMIEWIKQKNSLWKFDYTIFDTYVQLAMDVGIDKKITIYTPVPWGDRFQYTDEKTGNHVYESWAPGSAQYKTMWNIFLTDLKSHLQKKGWLDKTYLGINESEMKQTLAAIKVIKDHSKQWKITYAGDWKQELDTLVNDYSYLYGKEPTAIERKKRSERGATSTYYVCCNPAKPNTFVFSPPIEGRWISWYTAASGYDGFLRWAYDAWPADPMRDPRHIGWGAGDCMLVYPGANSCIRFEKLREGISDFEKIRILRQRAAISSDMNIKSLMNDLEQHLKIFTLEHKFDTEKIIGDVNKGRKLIEELSDRLPEKD